MPPTADTTSVGANPKLVYAREMQKMEGELNVLTGEALKKQYYELAVRYAQASYTGDCWFLMRNSKSVIDTVRVNEVDLAGKAAQMLKKAGEPKDFLLKEKVLFAKAYVYMNPSPIQILRPTKPLQSWQSLRRNIPMRLAATYRDAMNTYSS